MTHNPTQKLRLFLSYSHEDGELKIDLDKHLIMLKRSEKISVWSDRELMPGQIWGEEIKDELANADIILLLISVDFNNSKYIWEVELATALERHARGDAYVVPVILRRCEWHEMPYAKLQALPANGRPVMDFPNKDDGFTEVAAGIGRLVGSILKKNKQQNL